MKYVLRNLWGKGRGAPTLPLAATFLFFSDTGPQQQQHLEALTLLVNTRRHGADSDLLSSVLRTMDPGRGRLSYLHEVEL